MILHLERKFTSPTETFIANQINFQRKYNAIVFTVKHLNTLPIEARVFERTNNFLLPTKFLTRKQALEFLDICAIEKPSVIHGHFLTDSAFFHSFSKNLDIPKVCSGYGYDVSSFPERYFGFAKSYFKDLFREYNAFIAMSQDMAADMIKLGCPANKIIVHYHGVNTRFFAVERDYRDKAEFNILTVASLVPHKGHLAVLKALTNLKSRFPGINVRYNIVGRGPLLESLQKYVAEFGLTGIVTFSGLIMHGEELLGLVKKADIFVHPSMRVTARGNKEGIPGTIVEAMASGLPVIATCHAGIPEVITNEVNGLLVNENDHVAIADLICQLYRSPALRMRIGMDARRTALEKFDIRTRSYELEKIYDSLLNKSLFTQRVASHSGR